jgi:hypothetical protein
MGRIRSSDPVARYARASRAGYIAAHGLVGLALHSGSREHCCQAHSHTGWHGKAAQDRATPRRGDQQQAVLWHYGALAWR